MNLSYQSLLPADFSPASRVWIYQATRLFSIGEALGIEERLQAFTEQWQSHGAAVRGAGFLFFGQFIVLMADETNTAVSGCSTDSSVAFIKSLEKEFNTSLFDRTQLAFVVKNRVQLLPLSQLQYAYAQGFIEASTLYFNNTVLTKAALESEWIIPVQESWLSSKLMAV